MAVSRCVQKRQCCADYGYKLFQILRPTRRGGGVGILVKDNISIVRNNIPHLAHTTFEHIELLITSISLHIRLVIVYRPPQSRSCRHVVVDCYFVDISTLIGWRRKNHVLKNFKIPV